jgi:hypothetical protein
VKKTGVSCARKKPLPWQLSGEGKNTVALTEKLLPKCILTFYWWKEP